MEKPRYSVGHSEGFSEGAITEAIHIYNDEMHLTPEEITKKIGYFCFCG